MDYKGLFWKGDAKSDDCNQPRASSGVAPMVVPSGSPVTHPSIGSKEFEFDATLSLSQESDKDAKLPGYHEFLTHYKALAMVQDVKQRVAAAVATTIATHPTLDIRAISAAFSERIELLTGYGVAYEADSRQSEKGEQSGKQAAIADVDGRLREIQSDIAKLMDEKAQCESRRNVAQRELSGVSQKYESYRNRFAQAVANQQRELKNLLSVITGKESNV